MLITVIRCLRTSVSLLSAVANSQWLCTVDTMPVQARILLLVQVNCPNVETMFDNKNQCTRSHLGFKTYTKTGAKVPFPWYQSDITTQISWTTVTPMFVHQNLLTFKTFWQKSKPDLHIHTHTTELVLHFMIVTCKIDPNCAWWRLRPDHLVSYSTLQDPIILYLTQPYKTRSSCILYTQPYKTCILSLTQPYKTWSSCLLLNLTRPDHLVILNLTRPDHLVSNSMWPDQHAVMLIVNMLEQSIWMIA